MEKLPIEMRIAYCVAMGAIAIYFIASAINIIRTPKEHYCFVPDPKMAVQPESQKAN